MRGKGHRKKSKGVDRIDIKNTDLGDLELSKGPRGSIPPNEDKGSQPKKSKKKKEGKNWRFAYDLYCKEIISSNNPNGNTAGAQPSS